MPHLVMRWLGALLIIAGLAGCGAPAASVAPSVAPAQTLNVFAAASLTEAFTAIGAGFEAAHPGVRVVFNFGGSQQLAQQLAQGAPADVFASANQKQLDSAVKAGRVVTGTAQVLARNRLVVIFPQANPAKIVTLQDLARPGLKLDLAAKEVPVGQYALDVLDRAASDAAYGASFKAGVLKNVVSYEENVRAVLSKVVLGEADAGIVYSSDVSGASAGKVGQLAIPDALNTVAIYPIAAVSDSKQPALAEQFIAYTLSPDGQAALVSRGFLAAK